MFYRTSTTRHKFEASELLVAQAFNVGKAYQHLGLVPLVALNSKNLISHNK